MREKTFNFILNLVRTSIAEDLMPPTNSVSSGQISGLSGKEGDLPPIDLRKNRYKNLPNHYRDLFRRKRSAQPKRDS
jgi:hypothetical protein